MDTQLVIKIEIEFFSNFFLLFCGIILGNELLNVNGEMEWVLVVVFGRFTKENKKYMYIKRVLVTPAVYPRLRGEFICTLRES